MVLISCFSPPCKYPNNLARTRHQGVKALSPGGQAQVPKNHNSQGARQKAKAGDKIHTPGTGGFSLGLESQVKHPGKLWQLSIAREDASHLPGRESAPHFTTI